MTSKPARRDCWCNLLTILTRRVIGFNCILDHIASLFAIQVSLQLRVDHRQKVERVVLSLQQQIEPVVWFLSQDGTCGTAFPTSWNLWYSVLPQDGTCGTVPCAITTHATVPFFSILSTIMPPSRTKSIGGVHLWYGCHVALHLLCLLCVGFTLLLGTAANGTWLMFSPST
ncbi:hypothetical protein CONLIGDRAFT_278288 [Coniochaeta ligniaria NRRL 30616]|uniref:Uncharacterized protein n=1 Tax=Coniochaeta ligniaria NRRL 30616 TaxID=1408157 RepID=A0A1J7IXI3_9PEZI|nr:hypothetical protein CONLIGDRAFT_278288 [Coniochaeta ligniaria NRRL 30616]